VAGRVDRGHPAATLDDISNIQQQHGYRQFFATSAKTGQGVKDLRQAILHAIPWDRLPVTSSPKLWKMIREYLLQRRAGDEVLTRYPDLWEAFRQKYGGIEFSEAEFGTVIGHAQAQGLLWRLAFGDFVLLKPELLNDYAAAIVRAARRQKGGLGCVTEQDVLQAKIDFEDLDRLGDTETERSLLHAVVQLLLHRELTFRESGQLVFPTKFNRQRVDIPQTQQREVAYHFAGPIEEIYATLVVRLFNCGAFGMKELWKNGAEFYDSLDNPCGFFLSSSSEGQGVISVYFSGRTPDGSKVLFLRFIHEHLHRKALPESVHRQRIYHCLECGEEVENRRAIEVRVNKGLKTISCQFCDKAIELIDVLEVKFASQELLGQVRKLEEKVTEQRRQAVGMSVAAAKETVDEYDVFMAHNSADKSEVEAICQILRKRGLNPWLDKEQIPPGRWFQDVIQQAIRNVKSAAIFIGSKGLGRWQVVELRTFISQCVEREIPVIPVLLPEVEEIPEELVFLNEFNWVKLSKNIEDTEALDNLEWGITGVHPRSRSG
jgi:TIR domain